MILRALGVVAVLAYAGACHGARADDDRIAGSPGHVYRLTLGTIYAGDSMAIPVPMVMDAPHDDAVLSMEPIMDDVMPTAAASKPVIAPGHKPPKADPVIPASLPPQRKQAAAQQAVVIPAIKPVRPAGVDAPPSESVVHARVEPAVQTAILPPSVPDFKSASAPPADEKTPAKTPIKTMPAKIVPPPKPPQNRVSSATAVASDAAVQFDLSAMPQNVPWHPMRDSDAALYRIIFRAQGAGNLAEANAALGKLNDKRLLGHVLYQRYVHPSYRTTYDELRAWMAAYSDHPGADRMYKLAIARQPKGAPRPDAPIAMSGLPANVMHILSGRGETYITPRKRSAAQDRLIRDLGRMISHDLSNGAPTRALKKLTTDKVADSLDATEKDQIRAQIAMAYLVLGKPDDALKLGREAAARSAGWVVGLAAWRKGDFNMAATHFELAATSSYANSWMRSGAAYWASRAHLRAGRAADMTRWLELAARYPRTFYGVIATRALGWDYDFNWDAPKFTKADFEKLNAMPAVSRAMALVDAGQNHLAESELVRIKTGDDETLRQALLAYTLHANLPNLAMRLAASFPNPEGGLYDAALYPLLPWTPRDVYNIDRALIHAITRQESRFDVFATSSSGATGWMQLMPNTASYVTGKDRFKRKSGTFQLRDPEVNLQIGQRYVRHLLGLDVVGNDLLNMAMAYNAGPGNLGKWKRDMSGIDDPLFFIETIPAPETRNYVERVLANYWIYSLRMGQPTPTLDDVAAGRPARYMAMDTGREGAGATRQMRLTATR